MVNLKTKSDKHANDNEKRRRSIREREKAKLNRSQIIKNALANSTLGNSTQKIVFSDDENSSGENEDLNGSKKPVLFDDSSESENEDFEIREKTQFKGKKGFELLNLQSTYGNDERFKIDERFLEDEGDDLNEDENNEENSSSFERSLQLKILASVLGTSISEPEKEKKIKKRTFEMIRYDASKKEHEIYEIKPPTNITSSSLTFPRKEENKKRHKDESQDVPRPKVSKEKFYEVSSGIKNCFNEKQEDGQFSLLQTYGDNDVKEDEGHKEFNWEEESVDTIFEYMNKGIFKKKEDSDDEEEQNEEGAVAQGIRKEPFFFSEDDERFKEAIAFMNMKNSPEAIEYAKNFDETRRKLKEIMRLNFKKHMKNKDPFRNKVGGMNKKQLSYSKHKNPRTTFIKKKPKKKNFGRRT